MSNARIFCIGMAVGAGLLCAFLNHFTDIPSGSENVAPVLGIGAFIGCVAVALWGDRR